MTKEDLRACGKELVGFHKRFSPCFGRIECQGHAFHYLQGLLLAPKRKCVEPMALRLSRSWGVELSDRRAVKGLKLIAGAALLRKASVAEV